MRRAASNPEREMYCYQYQDLRELDQPYISLTFKIRALSTCGICPADCATSRACNCTRRAACRESLYPTADSPRNFGLPCVVGRVRLFCVRFVFVQTLLCLSRERGRAARSEHTRRA